MVFSLSSPEVDPKTKTQVHLGVGVRNNGKEEGKEDKGKACDKGWVLKSAARGGVWSWIPGETLGNSAKHRLRVIPAEIEGAGVFLMPAGELLDEVCWGRGNSNSLELTCWLWAHWLLEGSPQVQVLTNGRPLEQVKDPRDKGGPGSICYINIQVN